MPKRPQTFQLNRKASRSIADARAQNSSQRGYNSRWRKARLIFLKKYPLCATCQKSGEIVPATVVDHIRPHEGDYQLFWDRDNWQSLCRRCHNKKTVKHDGGFGNAKSIPEWLQPSNIPLKIICGPPGSGKSTYCKMNAAQNDIIIDLDEILADLENVPIHQTSAKFLNEALRKRNDLLSSLSIMSGRKAWFIVSAPTAEERELWAALLMPQEIIVLVTPPLICAERVQRDNRRVGKMDRSISVIGIWWEKYTQRQGDTLIQSFELPKGEGRV